MYTTGSSFSGGSVVRIHASIKVAVTIQQCNMLINNNTISHFVTLHTFITHVNN